ncbi:MAG: hypothetical protein IKP34_06030 [Bacteroidales bacterium]|nr:hypothetical protein [Bacteroidales bacterium]
MSWFNDFISSVFPHDGYGSVGEAAKAFFMPGAYAADKTNESNRQLASDQNETNWNRYLYDNAYNSPVAQTQRMRAAGLNPALMYDGGGSIATSSPPPDAVPQRDVAPDMTGMPTLQSVMQFAASRKLTEAQADYYASLSKTEDQLRDERYNALVESNRNMAKQTEEIAERIKSYVDQHKLTEAQLDKLKFDRVMEGKRYLLDKKRLLLESKLTEKQIEKLDADIQKVLAENNVIEREYQEMIYTFAIRKAGLEKQNLLTDAEIARANATAKKLGVDYDMLEGSAIGEKYYSESLQGKHGYGNFIIANVRSGVQMMTRDFGNIFGILK